MDGNLFSVDVDDLLSSSGSNAQLLFHFGREFVVKRV
jgi:hypothetical protein